MARDELDDGVRVAQLLASELDGLGGDLGRVSVTDADPDADPTADGAFAYAVDLDQEDGTAEEVRLAEVFVQPSRARVEFRTAQATAAEAAAEEGLRARPKASDPPRTLVFLANGAEAKRAVAVVRAVVGAVDATASAGSS
jgi:hypothetical protein